MGSIKVIIDDQVEMQFRRVAMKKFGYGRGALSDAVEAALEEWSSKEDVDEILTKGHGGSRSRYSGSAETRKGDICPPAARSS